MLLVPATRQALVVQRDNATLSCKAIVVIGNDARAARPVQFEGRVRHVLRWLVFAFATKLTMLGMTSILSALLILGSCFVHNA